MSDKTEPTSVAPVLNPKWEEERTAYEKKQTRQAALDLAIKAQDTTMPLTYDPDALTAVILKRAAAFEEYIGYVIPSEF